jgi:hypothetical protein
MAEVSNAAAAGSECQQQLGSRFGLTQLCCCMRKQIYCFSHLPLWPPGAALASVMQAIVVVPEPALGLRHCLLLRLLLSLRLLTLRLLLPLFERRSLHLFLGLRQLLLPCFP